jgi:hypothetical protein
MLFVIHFIRSTCVRLRFVSLVNKLWLGQCDDLVDLSFFGIIYSLGYWVYLLKTQSWLLVFTTRYFSLLYQHHYCLVALPNFVLLNYLLDMDPGGMRRQIIRMDTTLVVVLSAWFFVRFRRLYNSRSSVTYGPMSAKEE